MLFKGNAIELYPEEYLETDTDLVDAIKEASTTFEEMESEEYKQKKQDAFEKRLESFEKQVQTLGDNPLPVNRGVSLDNWKGDLKVSKEIMDKLEGHHKEWWNKVENNL